MIEWNLVDWKLAYMKNVKYSTTKIPLHHVADASSVGQSVVMGERLNYGNSFTSNKFYNRNFYRISTTE